MSGSHAPPYGERMSDTLTLAADAKPDGRFERGARTRERIVSAVLEMIAGGNLDPTSEAVAVHAGVGHRTVFRHFQDMESLFDELNAKIRALVEEAPMAAPQGDLDQRLAILTGQRARTFELITMYYLSGDIRLHGSPTLQRARAAFAAQQRAQLLAFLPEAKAAPEIADAADLIASIDGWLRLRRTQGLDVDQARSTVARALKRLLAGG